MLNIEVDALAPIAAGILEAQRRDKGVKRDQLLKPFDIRI